MIIQRKIWSLERKIWCLERKMWPFERKIWSLERKIWKDISFLSKKDMIHWFKFGKAWCPHITILPPATHQKKKSFGRFYFNFLWSGARWRWRHFWEKMTLWEWSEVTQGPIFENDGRRHLVKFLRMIGGDTLSNFWEWSPGPTFENDGRRHRVQLLRMIVGDTGSNFWEWSGVTPGPIFLPNGSLSSCFCAAQCTSN